MGHGKMKLNKIVSTLAGTLAATLAGLCVAFSLSVTSSFASGDDETPHYPLKHPKEASWSFAGPLGHWDIGQLQRGLKVYKEVCSGCHSMDLVAFRNLTALGYSDKQVKAFAAEYDFPTGVDDETRSGKITDRFPNPFASKEEAKESNNGAVPPDFSLMAKARAPERGFPTFVFDIFTLYAENGPDYIYSLLTGYEDAPAGREIDEGLHYNPYFIAGDVLAMAAPLSDDLVDYDDGSPQTVDQYSKDISAFLMWAAEPHLAERKSMGFKVLIFLAIFAALLYFVKKQVWAGLKTEGAGNARSATPAASLVSATPKTTSAKTTVSKKVVAKKVAAPTVKAKAKKASATKAKKPAAKRLKAGVDFIDDIELVDGIGATIAKRLQGEGYGTLTSIAKLSGKKMAEVADSVGASKRYEREEWQVQAREMIAGKPPRAKVDQDTVARLSAKAKK